MELFMNGMTVLCLMVLIVLHLVEMDDKKKAEKPEQKTENDQHIQSEFEKLMSYSEQDAINSKKR